MQIRGLLIAVVLLAGLGGLVYWSNQAEQAREEQPDADDSPKILELEEDNIARLEIRKKDDEDGTIALEKAEDGDWKLVKPEPLPTDQTAVGSLVSTVSSLDSNRLIEENATDLTAYGLDAPAIEVVIGQKDGKSKNLLIGDETPTGSYYYAKLGEDPRVFTMASWNKTSIDKSPWDLRDKRLLTFDSDKLSRIELTAKGQTIEIGKNANNEWQILEPRPLRADGGNVEQLVSRLRDAKMDSSMSDEEREDADAVFGKAERIALVEVTDAAGTQQLEVRKTEEDDYYALSSVVDGVYKITSYVGEGLDKGLEDLRAKKLFDFGWDEPSKIEIRDGEQTYVIEKSDDQWMRDGKQMDSVSVRAVIDELRDLSAASFPEEGFTTPIFEAEVTSDEGKRVEKVLISQDDGTYFAKREGEPSIYQLESEDFTDLRQAVQDVKEHQESAEE